MKKRVWSLVLATTLILPVGMASTAGFDKAEYSARRARLMEKIGDAAAVFLGAVTPAGDYEFRQGHDFFYMTGVDIPGAFLVVDGQRKESTLFFTMDEKTADGEGIPVGLVKDPVAYTGIERAMRAEEFSSYLAGLARRASALYTMFKPEELGRENGNEKLAALQTTMTLDPWDGRLTRELQFVAHLRDRFPQLDVRDCSPIVWDLRKFKSAAELELMRRAGQIGVKAHKAVIGSTRPGVSEKALASVFEFVSKKEGARDIAFSTIIMSGKNHAYGHYHAYTRTLKAGDFLILDAGSDYENYHVDISTTFPASGRFTPRQKELYEVALAVHDVCEKNYRPGVSFSEVGAKVDAYLKENGLGAYANDFRGIVRLGGYNHFIGLATHDVAGTFAGQNELLVPGLVFACDIQLFRLDEEIGIRIEDTIAITEDGYENLSAGLPRTVAEIEAAMREDGLLQILAARGY
ncbi:MAG: aminopeptidase P N-terminal domain-containing protein [Vicinamibacterales bacterium]